MQSHHTPLQGIQFEALGHVSSCPMREYTAFDVYSSFPVDHISPVTAMTSLEHVADTAAAGQVVRDYLAARGIRTTATLALMAKTESELEKHLMLPLFNGWKTESGSVLRIPPEEQPIVQAILLHMWSICRKQWADSMTPTPSLTATVPTSPGTASAKTSTSDDKVPKTLPPGTWSSLIRKYQEEQLHGVNRVFPQRELLGAESTLARMHHELHISRMFTPVQLGEIIEKRSFTASGDVNPLSKARKTQQLTVEDAQLVYHDEPTSWTPRSLLATLDGLTSIRWAMVLIEWGPEAEVERLFAWLTQRARSRPQKMEQFNSYFTAISWQLCMDLRGGISFAETAENITKDMDRFTEYMSRDSPVKDPPKKTTVPPPNPGKGPKGAGKKGTKHDSYRTNPYRYSSLSGTNRATPGHTAKMPGYREAKPDHSRQEWRTNPNK